MDVRSPLPRRAFARLALAAAFVAAAGAIAGCRGKNRGPEPVRIGYFANLTHAQAVLGVASGEFARAVAPSPLQTRVFNAGPSLIEALFAGEIDIGYVGPGPAVSAYGKSHGEGIRVIAGAAANGVVVVARKDSDIRSMKDLVGKRIATPQLGNTQDVSARHYVTAELGQHDAKNIVPIENAQQAAMLARGEVDAAWVPEPWGQRLIAETGATLVAEERDLWPTKEFVLTVVVTTPEFLERHGDVVARVLAVHRSWTKKLAEDPDAQLAPLDDALAALTGKRLSAAILGPALRRVRPTDEPLAGTLETFSKWTHDLRFDRGSADTRQLVDVTILRALIARDRLSSAAEVAQ